MIYLKNQTDRGCHVSGDCQGCGRTLLITSYYSKVSCLCGAVVYKRVKDKGGLLFPSEFSNILLSEMTVREVKNKITRYNFKGPIHIDKLCADTLKDNKKCFIAIQQDTVICGMLTIWSIAHPLLGTDIYNSVTTLVAETRYPFSIFTTTKDNISKLIPEMKRFTASIIKAERKASKEVNQWRKERMDTNESEVLVF